MGDTGLRVCMLYHIRKGSATNCLMSQQVIFSVCNWARNTVLICVHSECRACTVAWITKFSISRS